MIILVNITNQQAARVDELLGGRSEIPFKYQGMSDGAAVELIEILYQIDKPSAEFLLNYERREDYDDVVTIVG